MYIISENENLLERLGLLVLNSNILNTESNDNNKHETVEATEFVASLASDRHYCEPKSNFLVLLAKNWNQLMLDTIADLCRFVMAHSSDNQGNIVVIKKDAEFNDEEVLQSLILGVHQKWCEEWMLQFEKISKQPNSEAKTEALSRINAWIAPKMPKNLLLHFENPELAKLIATAFNLQHGLRIRDGFPPQPTLFSKPPALHWSHFPRDSEMQIMFKFTFPPGTISDPVFRDFAHSGKESFDFEYHYEWKAGIFLRHGLTKISIYRTNSYTVEVAGRIDIDEYSAEVEDDATEENPFKVVWPLLARVLKTIVCDCIEYRTEGKLPYMLNMAFFGKSFFRDLNYLDVNGAVNARLLDAVQAFAAIERTGTIKFGIGKRLMAIESKLAFPGFRPHSLVDIYALSDLPVTSIQSSTSSLRMSPVACGSNQAPAIPAAFEKRKEDDPSSEPYASLLNSTQSLSCSERSNSQTGLLGMGLTAAKNRGRRVSFGAIRAIPQNSNERKETNFEIGGALCPKATNLKRNSHRDTTSLSVFSQDQISNNSSASLSQSSVNEYVDKMLQKTIDEVLVMD